MSLFQNKTSDSLIDIGLNDYLNGFCIHYFNLSNSSLEGALPIQRKGHTRLDLRFSKSLSESVTVIIYSKFQSSFQLDIARNLIV